MRLSHPNNLLIKSTPQKESLNKITLQYCSGRSVYCCRQVAATTISSPASTVQIDKKCQVTATVSPARANPTKQYWYIMFGAQTKDLKWSKRPACDEGWQQLHTMGDDAKIQLKSSSWRRWLWRNEPVEWEQAALGYHRIGHGRGVTPSGCGEGGKSRV
jgi:hypothetical protein